MSERIPVVVLGGGPAGLAAAAKLAARPRFQVTLLEQAPAVGGNAGSFEIEGLTVDYGSHRLHPSCQPDVLADIRAMLGDDLLERPRHGRIRLADRWVHFPLRPFDLLTSVPPSFALGVLRDTVRRPFLKTATADGATFASVLESGLGTTICREFYFPYAHKIWGLPPEALDAEQARRRVSSSSVGRLIERVLTGRTRRGRGDVFFYPRRGFGRISDAYLEAARRAGADIRLRTRVTAVEAGTPNAAVPRAVEAVRADGPVGPLRLDARVVLSTIPLPWLVRALAPAAPPVELAAAVALESRAMVLAYLVLDTDRFTEYDAHYFPGADIRITRLSEPKNYGLQQSAPHTVLCAELPCAVDDDVWRAAAGDGQALHALVRDDLGRAGLPLEVPVREVVCRRLAQAYPIYTAGYREHFDRLDHWVGQIEGLLTLGRQGLFAHDNTHHTLAMAYGAAECVGDDGTLDRRRWSRRREEFAAHVVED